jgi:TP901 family phage tail tape measure protein
MANIQLKVVALGDFTSVNAQIKALQTQVQSLQKNIAGVGLNASLSTQLKNIQNEFSNALVSSGNFTKQTVQLTSETEKFGQALQAGKLKLGDYFGIITGRSAAAQKSVQALALEQVKLNNSIVQADITKQGVYSVYTPTTINATAKAVEIAAAKQNIFNIAVQQGSQKLIDFGKNTQWAGRQLTVGLSMPVLLFGSQAMKTFQDVNTELVRMQKVYGTGLTQPTQAALNTIKTQVTGLGKELAASMGVSLKDTAAMAADLAATGKTGNDLITATREAMRLSKLGELDTQAAMKATVSLQNVYKLSTQDLSGAVNFLNAVENQTSTSLQDLVDGIPRVGPIVEQLGGSFKDTAVMMVAMKEAGVPAAQSANAIKSAIASMINPTKAAKEAFAAYNINLAGIATSTKGNPVQMIMQLQQALKGLAPLAQAQLIEKLFGKFQEARIQALITNLGAVNSQTRTAFDLVNASAPQLAAVAANEMKIATESTTGKFKRAIETLKADLIPIGEKIMEVSTSILNFGAKIASFFNNLPGPIKSGLGILLTLGAIAGPVIMITGLFANLLGQTMKVGYSLLGLFDGTKKWKDLMTPAGIAAKTATEAFQIGLLENVTAVDTLNAALQKLIVSLEAINTAMNVSTGTSIIRTVEAGLAGGKVPFKAPGMATGGYVPGNPAHGDIYPALLTGGEAVIPQQQAKIYSPFINAIIDGNLPMHARGRRAGEVGIQSIGSNIQSASALGLALDKEGSRFARGENASYRGTFTAATPSSEFNSRLTGGTASPQEFLDFANKEGGRGARVNSGLYQFLKQQSSVSDAEKAEILSNAHKTITEHFSKLAKEGKTLSDQEFSKVFANANDTALADLLNRDSMVKENYLRETSAIGTASTPGTRRPNGKISGISISSIKDLSSTMRRYDTVGKEEREEFGDTAVQSHIVHPNLLRRVIGIRSPNLNVYGAEGVLGRSEVDALEGSARTTGANLINGIKTSAKQTARIKSPSEVFKNEVGTQIAQGTMAGVEEGISGPTGQSKIQSIFSKAFGSNSRLGGMMSSFSNMGIMGRMGIGMGLGAVTQMAAPTIDKMPGGSFITSAMSGASMGAGFGPWGIAAGAALSLVTHGVTSLIAAEKLHAAEAKADFTSSASAIQFMGGKLADTTSKLKDFNIILNTPSSGTVPATQILGKNIAYTTTQLSSFTNMVKSLPKDNPLSLVVKQVSDAANSGDAAKIANQFATLQMAINNISPEQAKQLEQLILTVGGKNAGAAISPVGTQIDAIKSSLNAALPNSKQFSQVIGQLVTEAANSNSMQTLDNIIKGIGASAATSAQQVQGLLSYFTSTGNTSIVQLISLMQSKGGFNGSDVAAAIKAVQSGASFNFNDLKGGQVAQELKDKTTAATDAKSKKQEELNKLQIQYKDLLSGTTKATNASTVATAADAKALQIKQKVLDANLKTLQDLQREATQATDYATTKEDLKNQILMAQSTGDNLKAQLLQQQLFKTTSDYSLTQKVQAAQNARDANAQKLADAQAAAQTAATVANTGAQEALKKKIDDLTLVIQNWKPGSVITTPDSGAPSQDSLKRNAKAPDAGSQVFDPKTGKLLRAGTPGGPDAKNPILPSPASNKVIPNPMFSKHNADVTGVYSRQSYWDKKTGNEFRPNGYVYNSEGNQIGQWAAPNSLGNLRTLASGGHISGPGSSTSDSIPAMLSNGEYVVNAGAVAHYGRAFFDSANAMHLKKGGVARTNSSITYHRQHMNRTARHFATGGYVPSQVSNLMSLSDFPHFAAGGAVNAAVNAGSNIVYNVNVNVDKIDSTVDMRKAIDEALKSAEARAKMSGRVSQVGVR